MTPPPDLEYRSRAVERLTDLPRDLDHHTIRPELRYDYGHCRQFSSLLLGERLVSRGPIISVARRNAPTESFDWPDAGSHLRTFSALSRSTSSTIWDLAPICRRLSSIARSGGSERFTSPEWRETKPPGFASRSNASAYVHDISNASTEVSAADSARLPSSPMLVLKDGGCAKIYGATEGNGPSPIVDATGPVGRVVTHRGPQDALAITAAGRHARESVASLEERGDQEFGIASCQFRAGPVDCWSLRVSPAPETRRAADTMRSQRPANAVRRQLSMSGVVPASPAGRPRASVETRIAHEVKILRIFQTRTKKIQY